jgi:hypothetical protein
MDPGAVPSTEATKEARLGNNAIVTPAPRSDAPQSYYQGLLHHWFLQH